MYGPGSEKGEDKPVGCNPVFLQLRLPQDGDDNREHQQREAKGGDKSA